MAIDTTGEWWKGDRPEDIREYLEALTADEYRSDDFRLSRCSCGSTLFSVLADKDEGAACRKCTTCGSTSYICDSEDVWEEAEPEQWTCVGCDTDLANVGVGYSLRDPDGDIRWIYLGIRCGNCGVLGCYAGWKIDYSPSRHLLDQA